MLTRRTPQSAVLEAEAPPTDGYVTRDGSAVSWAVLTTPGGLYRQLLQPSAFWQN